MSNSITPKLWKTFDYALCKTAGTAFHAVQFFNSFRPNATFTSLLLRAACYSHWDMNSDIGFMQEALEEARSAGAAGEVPIGAVIVHEGRIIAGSGNRTIRNCDPTAHAEIIVLREAARVLGNYRLAKTTLYVTVEPCSMCAGAMIQARIPRLVYGANDPKGGAVRTSFQILSDPRLNHQVEVTLGVLAEECAEVIQKFFAERR